MEMRERRAGLSGELGEAAIDALQGGGRLQRSWGLKEGIGGGEAEEEEDDDKRWAEFVGGIESCEG